jgi:hypothetical protein
MTPYHLVKAKHYLQVALHHISDGHSIYIHSYSRTKFHHQIFMVSPCINEIKHFNVQLMHTTLKT